jgi:hypothetical protein
MEERVYEMVANPAYIACPNLPRLDFMESERAEIFAHVTTLSVKNIESKKHYTIHLRERTCSCPSYTLHRECKHVAGLLKLLNLSTERIETLAYKHFTAHKSAERNLKMKEAKQEEQKGYDYTRLSWETMHFYLYLVEERIW